MQLDPEAEAWLGVLHARRSGITLSPPPSMVLMVRGGEGDRDEK